MELYYRLHFALRAAWYILTTILAEKADCSGIILCNGVGGKNAIIVSHLTWRMRLGGFFDFIKYHADELKAEVNESRSRKVRRM